MTSDVPPALTNGSGIPTTGPTESTIAILMMQWNRNIAKTPTQMSLPRGSIASEASDRIFRHMTANAITTAMQPMNPNTMPMYAKIKSL